MTNPGPSSSETAPLLGSSTSTTTTTTTRPLRPTQAEPHHEPTTTTTTTTRSPGVARIAAVSSQLTTVQRVGLFAAIFVVGYAYGLEAQVRNAYQPYATASFNLHSYLATINVLRSVVAVAAQPTAAKIADVFGRFEVVAWSTALYTLGIALEAGATGVEMFCAGAVVYQVGYTCIILLMEVLIADFSSMRARVFCSYIPAVPFLVNTWISGDVTAAVLRVTTWRWGIGMWAVIYPICSLPLLLMLWLIERKAQKMVDSDAGVVVASPSVGGKEDDGEDGNPAREMRRSGLKFLSHIDTVGLVLIVISFSLILAPLTITGRKVGHWKDPSILAPLIIGVVLLPIFVIWERKGTATPLVPFHLLTDRGVWAALAVRSLLNFAWYTQGNYLYTVLVVFGYDIDTATRIMSFFSFFGVVSGMAVGAVIYRLRRLKWIIVLGTCIFLVAFAVLIRFPGGESKSDRRGLVATQVVMGLAAGLFAYPTQASIQASASREHVAILTGLYLSFYNVGSALGTCLAGAIWTGNLLDTLQANLAFQPDAGLAEAVYGSPFDVLGHYPVGTDIRAAIMASYASIQRLLGIAGLCVCVPMVVFALALRNPKLSEEQTQPEAEEAEAVAEGEDGYRD